MTVGDVEYFRRARLTRRDTAVLRGAEARSWTMALVFYFAHHPVMEARI